jgi:hypothetical protein
VTGVGDSTSQGGPAPRRCPLPPPPPTTNFPGSSGEIALAARAAGTPHSLALSAPAVGSSSRSCALCAARSCPCRCAARATAWARGMGRSDCAASSVTLC